MQFHFAIFILFCFFFNQSLHSMMLSSNSPVSHYVSVIHLDESDSYMRTYTQHTYTNKMYKTIKCLPSLIQINQKDSVVSETCYSVSCWHRYNKSEHIINERVKRFVHECSPRQVRHGFQFIINKQLWQHKEESECINAIYHRIYAPRIPTIIQYNLN